MGRSRGTSEIKEYEDIGKGVVARQLLFRMDEINCKLDKKTNRLTNLHCDML